MMSAILPALKVVRGNANLLRLFLPYQMAWIKDETTATRPALRLFTASPASFAGRFGGGGGRRFLAERQKQPAGSRFHPFMSEVYPTKSD